MSIMVIKGKTTIRKMTKKQIKEVRAFWETQNEGGSFISEVKFNNSK